MAYEHREPRRPAPNAPEAVLVFDWNEVPVRLAVYPAGGERGSRRGQERARLAQVEALLAVSLAALAEETSDFIDFRGERP